MHKNLCISNIHPQQQYVTTIVLVLLTMLVNIFYFAENNRSVSLLEPARQNTALELSIPKPLENTIATKDPYREIINDYAVKFKQQEDVIWQKIENLGISRKSCTEHEQKYLNVYDKNETGQGNPVSTDTKNFVINILVDFNMDPNTIKILPYIKSSPAAASETVIFINESRLYQLSVPARKFVIGHEIQHLIYKDTITQAALEDIFREQGTKPSQKHNDPINELYRLQENRADLYAALKNEEYAQGFLAYSQERLNQYGDNPGITHPKNSERFTLAKQIFSTFEKNTPSTSLLWA